MNGNFDYFKEINVAVTICNLDLKIVYMNLKAQKTFEKWGGSLLIGKPLLDCHNPSSQKKISEILQSGEPNTYSIEKNGIKKIIHQTPWMENGVISGLIEFSTEVPVKMNHFVR